MSDNPQIPRNKLRRLVLFVCLCGAATAGLFGYIAAYLYGSHFPGQAPMRPELPYVGCIWGAVTGLIAAAIWCSVMMRAAALGGSYPKFVSKGKKWGIAVGALSTFLLHALLARTSGRDIAAGFLEGMIVAVPAGWIVGGLCGFVIWSVWNKTAPPLDPDAS